MAFDFSGKKVLVTGAGRGIGRGIALALAKAGCKVYALGTNQANLDDLASENSNIETIVQDLTQLDMSKATLEKLEPLDGLVNNAGKVANLQPAMAISKGELDDQLSLNVFAVLACCQAVGRRMVEAGRPGAIVNVSSVAAHGATNNFFAYCLSKCALDMVTKQLALELGPHNIRVNSVSPSIVGTDLIQPAEVRGFAEQILTERMAIQRVLTIEEVVGPVLYLLSDYSAMVTGTTHLVDGGMFCNITTKK